MFQQGGGILEKEVTVGDAKQRDVGRGIARLDLTEFKKFGVEAGDLIGLAGKRKTLAIAWPSYNEDIGKNIIRIDGFTRTNAGAKVGETIKVFSPSVETAKAILIAPIDMRLNVDDDFTNFVKNRLEDRALVQGDNTLVMMLGHAIPFYVVRVAPNPKECLGVKVNATTHLRILNEPYEPEKRDFSDIKFLFRNEWLQLIIQKLRASRVTYIIRGTDIEYESETKIFEKANEIVESSFNPVEILVKFYSSSEDLLGSLPYVSFGIFGYTTAIYPDTQLPTFMFTAMRTGTGETAISSNYRCFKIGQKCPKTINFSPKRVFVALPFSSHNQDLFKFAIRPALEEQKLQPWKADETISNIDIMCKICQAIQESAYVISDISEWNANVLFEMGLAYGMGKSVVVLKNKKTSVPVDLKGLEYLEYDSIDELRRNLSIFFKSIVK